MNFLPNTPKDREEMLKTIGVQSIEDLFSDIPTALRFKGDMNLPAALSEVKWPNSWETAGRTRPKLRDLYRRRGLRPHACRSKARAGTFGVLHRLYALPA